MEKKQKVEKLVKVLKEIGIEADSFILLSRNKDGGGAIVGKHHLVDALVFRHMLDVEIMGNPAGKKND